MCFGPQAEYIFPVIDFIDVFILVCLVISILNGHHRGFWLSTIQFLGMLVGVLLGSAIAPTVSQRIGITSSAYRPVAAILVLVITTTVVTSIAHWLADPLRLKAEWQAERQLPLGIKGELEKLAGAAFSALAVLVIFWFLGITFSRGPNQEIASQIKGSAIEQSLDALAPSPPPF
ncbi:MAG TPA: CvpA family protein, partial [Candidatus Dormibacteraeota bacterium]|nr:CvpA family protein [Candidatus Dormibacteraeota bacterium]